MSEEYASAEVVFSRDDEGRTVLTLTVDNPEDLADFMSDSFMDALNTVDCEYVAEGGE